MTLHPYSIFKTYLQSSYDEIVDSYVRHQQFYNFCNGRYPISKEKFERAMRQYIFESLPSGNNDRGGKSDASKEDVELGRALHHWDDFYFDLLNSGSSLAVLNESSENLAGKLGSQNLDNYCCLEKFSPSVLLQVYICTYCVCVPCVSCVCRVCVVCVLCVCVVCVMSVVCVSCIVCVSCVLCLVCVCHVFVVYKVYLNIWCMPQFCILTKENLLFR